MPTVALALLTPSGASAEPPVRVTPAEMLTAMRESRGYDLTTLETSIRIMSRWGKEAVIATEKEGFLVSDRAALERLTLA